MTSQTKPTFALIGTGKRVHAYYLPVLQKLQADGVLVVSGVYNRTEERGRPIAEALAATYFSSVDELLAKEKPDAVILSVPGELRQAIAERCLRAGIHLFVETPVAMTAKKARVLADLAREHSVCIEAAEDYAHMPRALLTRDIVNSGILGRVEAVINRYASLEHHGIARAHALFSERDDPFKKAVHYEGKNQVISKGLTIQEGTIRCDSKFQYSVHFPIPKQHILREAAEWLIVGEKGICTDREVILSESGASKRIPYQIEVDADGTIETISVTLRGQNFSWTTPAFGWTDKQTSLHYLLTHFINTCTQGGSVAYGIERAALNQANVEVLRVAYKMPTAVPAWLLRLMASVRYR